ncbi:FAD-dependent oxidoreductase [Streptomyces sp. MJP52]|uniref:NAD(P)/FAD-dependent oxidoreductase n=1 Tax=Streptomyces sp. MJP52 TaxID=2940555 RepID=UPI00247332DA|nr:FAD-dependent oxidoreductase [Streptomyces sp. MJP52]MDH6227378.1 3-phenylpropionate/trans-cinnamate dioxygenase ferredoxin reductase subunit [Streptomyces sp. MJP52]
MSEQTRERAGRRVVIVGAGMAGVRTAVALREQGFDGTVTLIGAEPHPPYDRPPLSKGVLLGGSEAEGEAAFDVDFTGLGIDLRLGHEVTGVRTADKEIDTGQGPVAYDVLVAATGARPVRLPGTEGSEGVHVLHTLDDARRLRPVLERKESVVVVGAGWIGAEFTTAAREAGCAVTVVEAAGRPLSGALPEEVARPMGDWYAESGATLHTGARVERVEPGTVVLADGRRLEADAVVVGIGARPATDWLAGAVELGPQGEVLADERLRASVPDVYAVGDCASFPSARYGERLLIHHWDNALQGAQTVAECILGETAAPYDPVPYFWSEQFGRFVQYAGHHGAADTLLWRGSPRDPAWSVCWLREGRLVALLAVGRPRDLAQGRRLIGSGAHVDPDLVRDPARPLKSAAA